MRIGIDLMGSDSSPQILFEAVIEASRLYSSQGIVLVVFATQPVIDQIKSNPDWKLPTIDLKICPEIIEMSDEPLSAIRKKKGSSMVMGMKMLRKGILDGFVSAGNTGALIAYSTLFLPKLPGIRRPALLATLPTAKGIVAVVDVGGNVYCKAEHLVQFAHIGAAYQQSFKNVSIPTVGLLNIGVESQKGTSELKEAYQLLEKSAGEQQKFQFAGNIEGRDVFKGDIDVLVTDGFTGNVFLKTSEGVSSFIFNILKKSIPAELAAQLEAPLSKLQSKFHYDEYAGAVICGIDRVAVKCHGHSSARGMLNAIKGTVTLVKEQFLSRLKSNK